MRFVPLNTCPQHDELAFVCKSHFQPRKKRITWNVKEQITECFAEKKHKSLQKTCGYSSRWIN